MNVQELIEELKKLPPLQPVRVLVRDGWDGTMMSGELDHVAREGNHIALEGK